MKRFAAVLGFGLVLAGSVSGQQPGDWVLARWQGGPYWFPGVVQDRSATAVTVAFDDGTRETLAVSMVRRYDWRVGSRVQCRWKGGTEWYAGEITAIAPDQVGLDVRYDDGDRERTTTGACRSS